MKKLELFVSEINEGRRPGSKNRPKGEDSPSFDELNGKTPEENGSDKQGIKFAVNEPIDDTVEDDIDLNDPDNTESMEDLIDKFDAEEEFFIRGRAGWGKTSIVRKLAKKFGREVITVYLDKAEATDLGGIPIPVEGNRKKAKVKNALGKEEEREFAVQIKAMPDWAKVMLDNPDKDFLLFFDEMNQAAPDVMNALMPIALDHEICGVEFDNFFVGAAGNMKDENDALWELSGPLKSRFKPIIEWDAGTPNAWKQSFKHLHKKWDKRLGKNFVDQFEAASSIFDNPREIEHKIFKFVEKLKAKGDTGRVKSSKYLRRLENLASEEIDRTERNKILPKLAELMAKCITNKSTSDDSTTVKARNRAQVPANIQEILLNGMEKGYVEIDGIEGTYGISEENIIPFLTDPECFPEMANAEMLVNYIDKLKEDGKKFKFTKNSEWQKAGYKDPLALVINNDSKLKKKEKKEKQPSSTFKKD